MLSAFKREAKIVAEIGDAAVLDSGFGLELERGDDRSGIDLRDLPVNLELGVFLGEHLRQQFEFVGIDCLLFVGTLQQAARGQLVSASGDAGHRRLGFVPAVGALGDFGIGSRFLRNIHGQRFGQNSADRLRRLWALPLRPSCARSRCGAVPRLPDLAPLAATGSTASSRRASRSGAVPVLSAGASWRAPAASLCSDSTAR